MSDKPLIAVLIGTRPELVKLAGITSELRRSGEVKSLVVFSGQHDELLESASASLGLLPDVRLAPLTRGRTLTDLMGHLVYELGRLVPEYDARAMLVQGDTVSALAGAVTSELLGIPLIHVEAGVRSGYRDDPFPEETIRRMISPISELHLCFSSSNRDNLIAEGIDPRTAHVVPHPLRDRVAGHKHAQSESDDFDVLITMHRRERRLERISKVIDLLTELIAVAPNTKAKFVWHPGLVSDEGEFLGRMEGEGIVVSPPLAPDEFLGSLATCRLAITDSAGVAEEAQYLGKPLLIFRKSMEVRTDDEPSAPVLATEDLNSALDFAVETLSSTVGLTTAISTNVNSSFVIARHIEQFARNGSRRP